jgi:hypothetical protein
MPVRTQGRPQAGPIEIMPALTRRRCPDARELLVSATH